MTYYLRSNARRLLIWSAVLFGVTAASAQEDLRDVVAARLAKDGADASKVCPISDDWVAARVFVEYGAMFLVEKPGIAPPKCMVTSEAELAAIQQQLKPATANMGGVEVTLQEAAIKALIEARADAAKRGLTITPRGGATASARSYTTTVELWNSRFEPALRYWVARRRIKSADAEAARKAPIRKQVEAVLAWEREGLFFSNDLSKSILYSVAIPGASQHNFLLAFDLEQFSNAVVRQIMAAHGWFQTVKSDLPHFTYLGIKEEELPKAGLRSVMVNGQKFWIPNILSK